MRMQLKVNKCDQRLLDQNMSSTFSADQPHMLTQKSYNNMLPHQMSSYSSCCFHHENLYVSSIIRLTELQCILYKVA